MSVAQDPSENTRVAAEASSSTESLDVQTGTPQAAVKQQEDALEQRAQRRKERWEKNHALAEEHNKAGDELFQKNDYAGAAAQYINATQLWSSNSRYYSNLADAYLKSELYVEAAHAATRALALDPKSIAARYRRGLARLEQRLLKAAKIDFETVLKRDPDHSGAAKARVVVDDLIEASTKLGSHQLSGPAPPVPVENGLGLTDIDFDFPHYDDEQLELASLSDSSDCNHIGNGIACRFYNHQGCARGSQCTFSHAPDEKSVRDDLGKNVCIYYLLSACKFGEYKCIYAHSKASLPSTRGWWNDEVQIAKVKQVLEMAEKRAREQRALDSLLLKLERSKARKAKATKELTNGKGNTPASAERKKEPLRKDAKLQKAASGKQTRAPNGRRSSDERSLDMDEEAEQRVVNSGFTDYELNDLLSQGVKPWDDDAHAVLEALSY